VLQFGSAWLALCVPPSASMWWTRRVTDFLSVYNHQWVRARPCAVFPSCLCPRSTFRGLAHRLGAGCGGAGEPQPRFAVSGRGRGCDRRPYAFWADHGGGTGCLHLVGSAYTRKVMPGTYSAPLIFSRGDLLAGLRRASHRNGYLAPSWEPLPSASTPPSRCTRSPTRAPPRENRSRPTVERAGGSFGKIRCIDRIHRSEVLDVREEHRALHRAVE